MPYLIVIILVLVGGVTYYFTQHDDAALSNKEPAAVVEESVSANGTPEKTAETERPNVVVDTDLNVETSGDKPTVSIEQPKPTSANTYSDGVYHATVTYQTPARATYALDVAITLTGDQVTDSNVTYSQGAEKDPNAQRFESNYKSLVMSKDLDQISLSRVGGASLTTGAFNQALLSIKADAKS